jgi:hypothetical protein
MTWERLMRPEIVGMLIPIAAIAMVGAIAITKLVIRHRERLAMIERGMNPDAPPQERGRQDPPLR